MLLLAMIYGIIEDIGGNKHSVAFIYLSIGFALLSAFSDIKRNKHKK